MSTITVRDAKIEDAARILEIYAYYVEYTVISFEWDVPSLEEFENRMRDIMKKYPYLVIEQDGKIEGYAYAHAFVGRAAYDWSSELTIYLDPNARKGGLGRRLYEELADRLKQRRVPCASRIRTRGNLPQLRLQIRPLVRYGLDGKNHRRAARGTAGSKAVQRG